MAPNYPLILFLAWFLKTLVEVCIWIRIPPLNVSINHFPVALKGEPDIIIELRNNKFSADIFIGFVSPKLWEQVQLECLVHWYPLFGVKFEHSADQAHQFLICFFEVLLERFPVNWQLIYKTLCRFALDRIYVVLRGNSCELKNLVQLIKRRVSWEDRLTHYELS